MLKVVINSEPKEIEVSDLPVNCFLGVSRSTMWQRFFIGQICEKYVVCGYGTYGLGMNNPRTFDTLRECVEACINDGFDVYSFPDAKALYRWMAENC